MHPLMGSDHSTQSPEQDHASNFLPLPDTFFAGNSTPPHLPGAKIVSPTDLIESKLRAYEPVLKLLLWHDLHDLRQSAQLSGPQFANL